MIKIECSSRCFKEKKYLFKIIFEEFLGLSYTETVSKIAGFKITLPNGKTLLFKSDFFEQFNDFPEFSWRFIPKKIDWMENRFCPESNIPIIFGSDNLTICFDSILCGLDIFASIFFMISRWEEIVCLERDSHSRFPGKSSLAWRNNFIFRPVVDEYVEMLWNFLAFLDPSLVRKSLMSEIIATCDVDFPFEPSSKSLQSLAKSCFFDLIKRGNPFLASRRVLNHFLSKFGCYSFDSNFCFDWYMNVLEAQKIKGVFYFITDSREPNNGGYKLNSYEIKSLLRSVHLRGFEIGVHGSYQSFGDGEKIIMQKMGLERILHELEINQKVKHNRQHFLRWEIDSTPDLLEKAGYEFDSTGGFADIPGFRFGTGKEFSMWSLRQRVPLKLKQWPLIMMENSILKEKYLGYGYSREAIDLVGNLRERCLKYNGKFVFLWHNSSLESLLAREFFCKTIGG